VGRGKSRGGFGVKFMCSGKRKDPKGKHVSDYAFHPHIGDLCIEGIIIHLADMINHCEAISMRGAREDEWYPKYKELQEKHNFPTCCNDTKGFGI
jgi:hypothetical protein